MKKTMLFVFLICLLIVSSAAADDLDAVKKSGTLRLAVSSDKAPFVFYDINEDVTGIDIKLMEEVANRMGVKLDVLEMSVNDLVEALEIEQADVAGGAFSKTTSRMNEIDFTRIYYIADPIFLSGKTDQLAEPLKSESFTGKRIGVLKNSGFEDWIRTELTDKGYAQKRDIYTYDKMDDAIRALDRDKVDLVLMDYSLYQSRYLSEANYKVYNYGYAKDSYAFGVRKGSNLKAEIDRCLAEMLKDGSAQKIADVFFTQDYADDTVIQWNTQKAAAAPTATPLPPVSVPTAIPVASGCSYSMAYVTDLTIPDGQPVAAGNTFTKSWRIKNTGTCPWTTDCSFAFVSGSQMNGKNYYFPTTVYPGNTIDISIDMTAPSAAGTYQGNWQLMTPQGKAVGYQLWVQIVVPGTYTGPEWASVSSDSSGSSSSSSSSVEAVPTSTPWVADITSPISIDKLATAVAILPTATKEPEILSVMTLSPKDYGKIIEQLDSSLLENVNVTLATPFVQIMERKDFFSEKK